MAKDWLGLLTPGVKAGEFILLMIVVLSLSSLVILWLFSRRDFMVRSLSPSFVSISSLRLVIYASRLLIMLSFS
jgi:peptidoglycan biosynthesis protein MviN/MurJ (putative lipid II flippase)